MIESFLCSGLEITFNGSPVEILRECDLDEGNSSQNECPTSLNFDCEVRDALERYYLDKMCCGKKMMGKKAFIKLAKKLRKPNFKANSVTFRNIKKIRWKRNENKNY